MMSVICQNEQQAHDTKRNEKFNRRPLAYWVRAIAIAGIATPLYTGAVLAQEAGAEALEEITVTGTRKLIQDQIAIKRDATTIVDGLSASDIGELPALSIGEALEAITGVASHRENGGASEITIRGLGPFLSATNFNGREATNGSGDRSVNFSQFPSELMSKVAVAKTQDASMIEGGVAGVIMLETLKPLDYGKQRVTVDAKLNYNPDEENIDNTLHDELGYRGTFSYVDQFEFGDGQAIGVSVGVQQQSITQPEAEYRSSSNTDSSLWACLNDPTVTDQGFFRSNSDDCENLSVNGSNVDTGYNTSIDPDTGKAFDDGRPYAWAGSSRTYRQNETSDERDSLFFAVQYQPSEAWDINFDAQLSDRIQAEERHDFVIYNKRSTAGVTGSTLLTNSANQVIYREGQDYLGINGEKYNREENYQGYGINVAHDVNERLTVKLDIGYSETNREEQQITNDSRSSARKYFIVEQGANIPNITVENFDANSYEGYNNFRTRIDTDNVRENITKAIRLDFDYALTGDTFTSVAGGIRSSELTYVQLGGNNGAGSRVETTRSYTDSTIIPSTGLSIADSCGIAFRESNFLDRMSHGPLITNVDVDGNVIAEGTGNTFATYDNQCFSNAMIELHNANPANANNQYSTAYPDVELRNPNSINLTETTIAAYAMANFESQFLDRGLRGNVGLRIVQTDISSIGYRAPYSVITDPDTGILTLDIGAGIEDVEGGGTYTEYLPSVNLVWDFTEDKILRGGVYRGMSRVNPTDMAYNRSFNTADEDTDPMTLDELLTGAKGTGNPDLKPLMSWNADLSLEWYPTDDALFSAGVYYKKFLGGFEKRTQMETFLIDGQNVALPITNDVTSDSTSNLLGLEFTAAYRWDSGIGVKMGYNWADTDFEVEDSLYGDTYTTDLDGVRTQLTDGMIAPASIPGFSEHMFTGQVYYQIGELDMGVIYKYRSDYFQPSTSNATRLRYIHSVGTWEARASYNITDNVKVKVEGINLFNAPKKQDYFEQGNLGEVNDYGPRLFVGVTVKF